MIDAESLAQIAMEIEESDPIMWDTLAVDQRTAYCLMAANVVEEYNRIETYDDKVTLLATVTKLLVDNFVLQLKLMEMQDNK